MSLRCKVAWELSVLALLTAGFLVTFPKRSLPTDLGLAALALAIIGLTRKYTKAVVWAGSAPSFDGGRFQLCAALTLMITLPVMVLFLMLGVITGYKAGGWPGVASRILNWHSLVAFACYLPWALAQQTLFQFYLLGRLLALFPKTVPFVSIAITGLAYSLVHLPDIWSTLVTAGAGVVWSWLYCRYRVLLPLAASHAALGTTFYYWVCGRDLFDAWRSSIA